jgi:hypothetical protein
MRRPQTHLAIGTPLGLLPCFPFAAAALSDRSRPSLRPPVGYDAAEGAIVGVKAIERWRQRVAVAVERLRVAGCAWLRSSGCGRGGLLQQEKLQRRVGPRSVAQVWSGAWSE